MYLEFAIYQAMCKLSPGNKFVWIQLQMSDQIFPYNADKFDFMTHFEGHFMEAGT